MSWQKVLILSVGSRDVVNNTLFLSDIIPMYSFSPLKAFSYDIENSFGEIDIVCQNVNGNSLRFDTKISAIEIMKKYTAKR